MSARSLLSQVESFGRRHHSGGTEFDHWTGTRPVSEVEGVPVMGPAFYHSLETFRSMHLASYAAVCAQLPSADLYPVRWFDGRAVVMVAAFRYREISLSHGDGTPGLMMPYGEVMVAALVTREPSRPGLPLLAPNRSGVGAFVLDLPVTTAEACALGRQLFGLPKFFADMDFRELSAMRQVTVSEHGQEVLTLTVRPWGPVRADRAPAVFYSVLDGQLQETTAPFRGHRQYVPGPRSGELSLGSHPVADRLRTLEISANALVVMNYVDARMILPLGNPVGPARDYQGYTGEDRLRGRLTVQYPGTDPLDQYAPATGVLRRAAERSQ